MGLLGTTDLGESKKEERFTWDYDTQIGKWSHKVLFNSSLESCSHTTVFCTLIRNPSSTTLFL